MRYIVTGVSGFIGSHLAELLLEDSYPVIGIDCFTDYYSRQQKEQNITHLAPRKNFKLIEDDLIKLDIAKIIQADDIIFHLAAQPGVRQSWGKNFPQSYVRNNIIATQKILEAIKKIKIKRLVYASSSSIYGNAPLPMKEKTFPQPISPYGITKLTGENLVRAYAIQDKIPALSLRFFTVYGPRQRPDMAIYRFIRALYNDEEITIFGDGNQTRDLTYVGDIIQGCQKASQYEGDYCALNLGSGKRNPLIKIVRTLEKITGRKGRLVYKAREAGDAVHTLADINHAKKKIGYMPSTKLPAGLKEQAKWFEKFSHTLRNKQ